MGLRVSEAIEPSHPYDPEYKRSQRAKNMAVFAEWQPKLMALGLVQKNEFHFTVDLQGETVQYWPSTGKWYYNKKTYDSGGTPETFYNWLERRTAKLMK